MANDSFKVKKGLNIEPNAAPNLSTDGDIGFNSSDSNLEVYTGGSVKKVITNSQTQTLTNKTLTAPVISTISNTGTLTLPTSTDTLVGRATTDTLTNKTLTAPTIDAVTFDGQASAPSNPSSGFYKVYVDDTTSKLQILDSAGTVTTVGTSAGGINYITNGDAEAATTGWATYADAAGTSPVDGTGGSPTVTFTRSTTNPLRGLGSFLLTKDAANRQGEGASYAFTIADADKAKMMQIDFELEVNSGTYATGDVAVYIVDVTNATVIQPAGYQVENVGIESRQRLTFQTASNSTSYRLCFHVASTSASAYALKIDTITLGPQVVPLGAPVTDWVSYTPSFNATTGHSASNAWWYRIGEQLYMGGSILFNGTGAATTFTVSLPTGLVIDTAKLNDSTTASTRNGVGQWRWYDDSGGLSINPQWIRPNTTTTLSFMDGSNSVISNIFANNDRISWTAVLPIVGWSSSTVVSSSAETRVVAAQINGTPTSSLTGSYTTATWNTSAVVFDTHGAFNAATGVYTAPVPGVYEIAGCVEMVRSSGSATQAAAWRVSNNTQSVTRVAGGNTWVSAGSEAITLTGSTFIRANAGDQIVIQAYSAGSGTAYNAGFTGTNISINLIQGPSQIAASEVVSMLCYKNTGSHTSTGNLQDVASWNAVTKDSHGGFNTTTGIYTCPAPGDYYVDARVGWASNVTGVRQCVILKGSTIVQYSPDVTAAVSIGNHVGILIPNCVAGDTIKVQGFQSSGGNLNYNTTANSTSLSIFRLGGVL